MADLLELRDENPFRIRAYRKAARQLEALVDDLRETARCNPLTRIPGIGKDLTQKIQEILHTGALSSYEALKKELPSALLELIAVPGLEPKIARYLYEHLRIETLEDLENLARSHMLRTLPGIGAEVEEQILQGISSLRSPAFKVQ